MDRNSPTLTLQVPPQTRPGEGLLADKPPKSNNDRHPEPTAIVAGKYLLLGLLGAGGMGRVYRVRHLLLNCERALKTIRPGLARLDILHRFEREAQALALFRHPHVVTVHDMGMDDGLAYIEMELIPGLDLDRELRSNAPLDPSRTLRLALQLCDALRAAHGLRIVHRDLKPSNLILEPTLRGESLRVLDFGLAKLLDESLPDDLRTRSGEILGTVAYMSPEQAGGQPTDERTDIYSTGIILYECLVGRRPFNGTALKILEDHKTTPPPSFPKSLDLPESLERLVLSCLAKDPDDRPSTAKELGDLLEAEREAHPTMLA